MWQLVKCPLFSYFSSGNFVENKQQVVSNKLHWMMSVGARSWQVVKPHIPLIKFRKGGKEPHAATNNHSSQMQSSQVSKTNVQTKTVIDESQLPSRYSRKPLSQLEMETIERGGPE